MNNKLNCIFTIFLLLSSNVFAAEPIATSLGNDGVLEADVIKAKVSDNVLTVAIKLRNDSANYVRFKGIINDCYYIVKSESKKYHVLKDSTGKWLADPLRYGSDTASYNTTVQANASKLIWMKFPAPPESETTVDLSVQGILPFDGLAISR